MLKRIVMSIILILSLGGLMMNTAMAATQTADEWVQQGDAAVADKDYDAGISYYTKAIKLDPENFLAYFNRGIAYFFNGDDKCIADITTSLRYAQTNVLKSKAYELRAMMYNDRKMKKEAIADYKKALSYNELSDEDRQDCIKDLKELGVDVSSQTDTSSPDKPTKTAPEYLDMGREAYRNGEIDKAIDYFNRGIAIDTGMYYLYMMRSLCYIKKNNYTAAIKDCDKAIALKPDDKEMLSKIYYVRAVANYKEYGKTKKKEVLIDLLDAIENDKYYYAAYDLLIAYSLELKDYDMARKVADLKAQSANEQPNWNQANEALKQQMEIDQKRAENK